MESLQNNKETFSERLEHLRSETATVIWDYMNSKSTIYWNDDGKQITWSDLDGNIKSGKLVSILCPRPHLVRMVVKDQWDLEAIISPEDLSLESSVYIADRLLR